MTNQVKYLIDLVMVVQNCASALEEALTRVPRSKLRSIVVVDNGSQDNSAQVAQDHGAVVLHLPAGGYGIAASRALRHLETLPVSPGIVVFYDPLGTHDIAELDELLTPFFRERAELVLATKPLNIRKQKRYDEKAILKLISVIYGHRFSELTSMMALRYSALVALGLNAEGEGWNVEILVKAVRLGLNISEMPIGIRAGVKSKVKKKNHRRPISAGRKILRVLRHSLAR